MMRITLVGFNVRKGTSSKTGKPYECTEVFYVYPRNGMTAGGAVASSVVFGTWLDPLKLKIGSEYIIDFDMHGNVVNLAEA